jgi:hypothetical protein
MGEVESLKEKEEVNDVRELIYKLPRERDKVAEIIRAIPSSWYIEGCLFAPRELYEKNQIAENTRLNFSRSTRVYITHELDLPYEDEIENKDDFSRMRNEKNRVPRIDEIVLERKLFSSVRFDLYSEQSGRETVEIAKELAKELIKKGYKGWIFARDSLDTASFNLNCRSNTVSLRWDEAHDEERENLNGILNVIKSLELELCGEKITS